MRWSVRQFCVLLIAVFVAAGLGLPPVQASEMAAKMAMASDVGPASIGMPFDEDCAGCPNRSTDNGKTTTCIQVCVAQVLALLPRQS
jgi:hypothetical protein